MQTRYTDERQGGRNLSLPLHMDRLPTGAQSVAWMLVDRNSDYVHWLVVDVPASHDIRLQEGASGRTMPEGARELFNDAGFRGYEGPDPTPRTGDHRYELVAYALDTPTLEIDDHAHWSEFSRAAEAHALATGDSYWLFRNG